MVGAVDLGRQAHRSRPEYQRAQRGNVLVSAPPNWEHADTVLLQAIH